MSTRLEFRILGTLEVAARDEVVAIAGPRQRTVLAMLLTSPDRVVSVEALTEAMWSGSPPATGRTQVAICVAGLRKAFRAAGCDEEVVATARPGYRLVLGGHRLDAHEFLALVEQAREAVRRGRARHAARLFGYALARWRGPALEDAGSQLVRATGAYWDEERLSAYEQYTALRLDLGEHQLLLGELTEAVRAHPLREQARAQLMLAYYRCGRRAEALAAFHDGRQLAVTELGLEPGPELRDLHRAILRDDPGLRLGEPAAAGELFGVARLLPDLPAGSNLPPPSTTGPPTTEPPTTDLPAAGPPAAGPPTAGPPAAEPPAAGPPAADLPNLAGLDRLLGDRLERSYRALPPTAAIMYRRLALAGPDGADLDTAAALLGSAPPAAEQALDQLARMNLVEVLGRDTDRRRFRLSGLRRLYALARAGLDDSPAELRAAQLRLGSTPDLLVASGR